MDILIVQIMWWLLMRMKQLMLNALPVRSLPEILGGKKTKTCPEFQVMCVHSNQKIRKFTSTVLQKL